MTGNFWMAVHVQGWCGEKSDEKEIGTESGNLKDPRRKNEQGKQALEGSMQMFNTQTPSDTQRIPEDTPYSSASEQDHREGWGLYEIAGAVSGEISAAG